MTKNPHAVVFHPFVTEKTMAGMERENKIEFLVARTANKQDIAKAVEVLFDAKVERVNTKISMRGEKHAIVKFAPETKAEEIGMRIGIF